MVKIRGFYAKNNYESYDKNFNGPTERIYLNSNPNSLIKPITVRSKQNMTSFNITKENPSKSFYNYNFF